MDGLSRAETAGILLCYGALNVLLIGGWILVSLHVLGRLPDSTLGWFVGLVAILGGISAAPIIARETMIGMMHWSRSIRDSLRASRSAEATTPLTDTTLLRDSR